MRIGLVDVDGHNFPNYALMRISGYHKAKGDKVEWAVPLKNDYDIVYKSKIFTFTPDDMTPWNGEIIKGGTGYDIESKLPPEIEAFLDLDYSIYHSINIRCNSFLAVVFANAPFCLVRRKPYTCH